VSFEIVLPDGQSRFYNLGPHPPRLWPGDVELAHRLWLELSDVFGARLHHRDIVGAALRRMAVELRSERSEEVLAMLERELNGRQPARGSKPPSNDGVVEAAEEGLPEVLRD
jgi:hypothetical protein